MFAFTHYKYHSTFSFVSNNHSIFSKKEKSVVIYMLYSLFPGFLFLPHKSANFHLEILPACPSAFL